MTKNEILMAIKFALVTMAAFLFVAFNFLN